MLYCNLSLIDEVHFVNILWCSEMFDCSTGYLGLAVLQC